MRKLLRLAASSIANALGWREAASAGSLHAAAVAADEDAPSPSAAAPLVDCLPDDVIIGIFAHIDVRERIRSTALVCRRWHRLCHSSELLQSVLAFIGNLESTEAAAQSLASLKLWLQRYAVHVPTLQLCICLFRPTSPAQHKQVERLAQDCLLACAAAARLQDLRLIVPPGPLTFCGAIGRLHSLTRLHLDSAGGDLGPLCNLTALRQLSLHHLHRFSMDTRLPAGLTRLHLGFRPGYEIPGCGLSALTNLQSLELQGDFEAMELPSRLCRELGKLTRLRNMALKGFYQVPVNLPASLAALTQLQLLELRELGHGVDDLDDEGQYQLSPALAALTQLTGLVLYDLPPCLLEKPPQGLAQMTRLRGLHLACQYWSWECKLPIVASSDSGGGSSAAWLAGLRRLSLDWVLLQANRELLAAAGTPGLQQMQLVCFEREVSSNPRGNAQLLDGWEWLWAWAASHPTLLKLDIEEVIDEDEDPGQARSPHRLFNAGLQRLQNSNPRLTVEVNESCEQINEMKEECLGNEMKEECLGGIAG